MSNYDLENTVQTNIINYLNSVPSTKVVRVISAGQNGVSDILVCHNGMFMALEIKRYSNSVVSDDQKRFINEVIHAGGIGAIVTSIDDVRNVLKYPDRYKELHNIKYQDFGRL